jgi:hypothetical protein
MQTHGAEQPPFLGKRIGVDKERHLRVMGEVFAALAGVNTHPDVIPLGGRSVTSAEEIAEGARLKQELADLIASRLPATQIQTLTPKAR